MHGIALNFFGSRATGGYAHAVPASYFTHRHNVNPDAPSAELTAMRYMRYLSNNEVPTHSFFNMDAAKPLSEHRGAWISSRTLYEKPEPWRPMAGLFCGGNRRLCLTEEQADDDANKQRLLYHRMPHQFTAADRKEVKDQINSGALNEELFWLARRFYAYITKAPHLERLHPIPPRIRRETTELFERDVTILVQNFIENHSMPARVQAEASTQNEVRVAVAAALDVPEAGITEVLRAAGLVAKRTGVVRIFQYHYPVEGLRPVKLN